MLSKLYKILNSKSLRNYFRYDCGANSDWETETELWFGLVCLATGINPPVWLRCLPWLQPLFTCGWTWQRTKPIVNGIVPQARSFGGFTRSREGLASSWRLSNEFFKQKTYKSLHSVLCGESTGQSFWWKCFISFPPSRCLTSSKDRSICIFSCFVDLITHICIWKQLA